MAELGAKFAPVKAVAAGQTPQHGISVELTQTPEAGKEGASREAMGPFALGRRHRATGLRVAWAYLRGVPQEQRLIRVLRASASRPAREPLAQPRASSR